jgi:hypothetical protein
VIRLKAEKGCNRDDLYIHMYIQGSGSDAGPDARHAHLHAAGQTLPITVYICSRPIAVRSRAIASLNLNETLLISFRSQVRRLGRILVKPLYLYPDYRMFIMYIPIL